MPTSFLQDGTERFGKDVSAKKLETFRQIFNAETSCIIWFCFWFSTNWLGPVWRIPACRIPELKKNEKTNNIGLMQSIKRASDMSPFPLGPAAPWGRL